MDMLEDYLRAVSRLLPKDKRDDIIAELRDEILTRIEAKEEELGRTLTPDETEQLLRDFGHPIVVAARYREELAKAAGVALLANGPDDVPHLQPLLLPTTALRDAARKRLAALGYETALQYPPGHYFSRFAESGPLPAAEEFYRRVVCLPLHSGVDEADARRIAAELIALLS